MRRRLGPAERTLPGLLRAHAEEHPSDPFVIDELGTLSWGAAAELAFAQAARFWRLGVRPGDRVGIMLENRRELLASWFGLGSIGAIEVPIDPCTRADRLVHMLGQSGCRELVIGAGCLGQLDAVADRLPLLTRVLVVGEGRSEQFDSVAFNELDGDPAQIAWPAVRCSDPVAVMFTSGSTGPAKGVVLSHGQHYVNGYHPAALFDIGPGDVVYVCLPLHHNMAQGYGVCVALASGAAVRIAPRFGARRFWPDVREHRATILSFVGAMLVLLAKEEPRPDDDQNPLRLGFGVPIPAELHARFEERFGMRLVHCYGSTEATIVTWNDRADSKPGAVGRPLPDYDVRVLDDDDVEVPAGVRGQICVRPHEPCSMFSGYVADAEATVASWRNLWFHTGDRGWFDDDGDLWFSDRLGDVVRHMGELISSSEVEQALLSHPAIRLAAVYGVASELIEEEVMAAVVMQDGARLDAESVRAWCAERLVPNAVPRFVEFLGELPMTPTGKVEKFKLRHRGVTAATDDARATSGMVR
jgi:crotonobetaine/carnitine-CoA ligase